MSPLWPERDDWPDGASWLDAELRGATPPSDLVARLQAIPIENDADLDRLLRDVPTPAGFVGRLCQFGASLSDDRKRRARVERKAVAVTLAAVSWCSYAAALILCWAADYQLAPGRGEGWLHSSSLVESGASLVESELAADEIATILDGALPVESHATSENAAANRLAAVWRESSGLKQPGPEQLLAFYWPSQFSPRFDFSVLLDSPVVETQPVLAAAIPQGAGFNRDFLSRTGVFPRIDPRNQPWSRPPLSAARDCLPFVRECLDAGRLPPPAEIRPEEFLAAIDYGFDRPKTGALSLAALGGRATWPSPQGSATKDRSLRLLQLAVQAKDAAKPSNGSIAEVVAENVRLSVRFNPQAVKSYRLCGHEPTRLEGPHFVPACDLSAGQAATVVYELELYGAADAEIATVALEWRDAASDAPQVRTRSVRSHEIAAPLGKADESVQLAALAVAAAEILRRSPFAEPISPAEMLALARAARAGAERPQEFKPWIELFERIVAVESLSERAPIEREGQAR